MKHSGGFGFVAAMSILAGLASVLIDSAAAEGPVAASASEEIFTLDQVERGSELYSAHCASCHQQDMSGKEPAPELAGDKFLTKWKGRSIQELLVRTKTTMPLGQPASLTDQEYLDVIATMLDGNGFPAGTRELRADVIALDASIIR